jgi:hypothetical protein
MMGTRFVLIASLLYGFMVSGFVEASIVRDMTLDDLVQEADQIVVGKVLSVQSDWDSDHRTILTTIRIQVNEGWKGILPNDGQITLVQQGGTIGDTEMAVQGMPQFLTNEQAVLFLRGSPRQFVLGMSQGKRTLRYDEQSKRWFAEPPSRAGVIRLQRKNASKNNLKGATIDTRISLDDLRNEVRSRLKK